MLTSPRELLQKLISLPSVNPMGGPDTGEIYYETRVADFLISWGEELGIEPILQPVSEGRTNVILLWR
ncbi:MAG: hypothetical protein JJ992_09085, partial [Planctomycetes bacterium]|nr:hypothetical protein [Planctomycetota bacterium]